MPPEGYIGIYEANIYGAIYFAEYLLCFFYILVFCG